MHDEGKNERQNEGKQAMTVAFVDECVHNDTTEQATIEAGRQVNVMTVDALG